MHKRLVLLALLCGLSLSARADSNVADDRIILRDCGRPDADLQSNAGNIPQVQADEFNPPELLRKLVYSDMTIVLRWFGDAWQYKTAVSNDGSTHDVASAAILKPCLKRLAREHPKLGVFFEPLPTPTPRAPAPPALQGSIGLSHRLVLAVTVIVCLTGAFGYQWLRTTRRKE